MENLLTIAIPTFNRASRLEKSLNDLLTEIIKSEKKQYVSVFVSDNGSNDGSAVVISKYSDIFKQNNINFSSYYFLNNRGFDANIINCYRSCNSEYVWFLSDDDNIIDGSINLIIGDIKKYAPSVLYYNFDQDPYNLENPYIKEDILYNNLDENNIQSILKIIMWPKLTSLVIRKIDGKAGEKVKVYEYEYMHVALAIQTGLDYGRVFHSGKFIGRPDNDYKDHIDFLPFIGNNLKKTAFLVLNQNNREDIYQQVNIKTVDPLTSSISTLGNYYRGKFVLTTDLKSKLYSTVLYEFKYMKISKIKIPALLFSIIKLLVSYAYNIGHVVFTGQRATRLRTIKKNV